MQQETDQGVSLVVLDMSTKEVVYIDRVESSHPLRMHTPIGMRFPWNCTAAGKAIMAFLPEIEAKPLLTGELPRRTSASVHAAETLRAQFLRVRANGYATDNEENAEGVRCVAAPVFRLGGSCDRCDQHFRPFRANRNQTVFQAGDGRPEGCGQSVKTAWL